MEIQESVADSGFADQYCPPPVNILPADQVGSSYDKKVFWKCDQGHTFKKSPGARSIESTNNNGCPICREERIKKNKKSKKGGK